MNVEYQLLVEFVNDRKKFVPEEKCMNVNSDVAAVHLQDPKQLICGWKIEGVCC